MGLSMLKGMAFGRAVRAAGLSSLYIMARPFFGKASRICPLIDARLNHVYAAVYDGRGNTVLEPRAEEPKSFFSKLEGKVQFVGPDATGFAAAMKVNPALSPVFAEPAFGDMVCAAAEAGWGMFEKGETRPVEELEPLYLRPSYAEVQKKI
jgi:tRNA A37 threonylcarbamoyladenosine modification protein TsaB